MSDTPNLPDRVTITDDHVQTAIELLPDKMQRPLQFLAAGYNTKTVAELAGVTTRELRRWLRSSKSVKQVYALIQRREQQFLSASTIQKRAICLDLVRYGMQRQETNKGVITPDGIPEPPIYELKDPRVALAAVQELNRMDHEYERDVSSSAGESQADRIARLQRMDTQ